MLKDFRLAAISPRSINDAQIELLQIPLSQQVEDNLSRDWSSQYIQFATNIREIDFDPGYKPDENDRFSLAEYKLPKWLIDESVSKISDRQSLSNNEARINLIKGIVAFARTNQGEELLLFQNFRPSQVIRPRLSLYLHHGTYNSMEHPGLMLVRKLSAIYQLKERKLLFDNFRNVNTFLPLEEFYSEASERDIREILSHNRFAPENPDEIATDPDQWTRKRFSMLRDSEILDKYSANDIVKRSEGHDISIQIKDDRIVFPANKKDAKRLLQFLNEELFRGPITDTLYETNSKKKAE